MECQHGLEEEWCSICKHGVTGVVSLAHAEAYTAAKFDGVCDACGGVIEVGDGLALIDDSWVHDRHAL